MISDLHIHSNHSDGSFSVGEVVDLAVAQGMQCISVTDHDTVSGVGAALYYGEQHGIKVLPGIEFSASTSVAMHILGYGFDYTSTLLSAQLDELIEKRHIRADKIIDKLARHKIIIDKADLPEINIGRSHIALAMVSKGYCSNINEAFDRYLGTHKLAYVPDGRITPISAVKLIKELGGMSVIAHPLALLRQNKLVKLIEELKEYGLSGLEVYYPGFSEGDTRELQELADKYGLFYTGGSDFHGGFKSENNMLGKTNCQLPAELASYFR